MKGELGGDEHEEIAEEDAAHIEIEADEDDEEAEHPVGSVARMTPSRAPVKSAPKRKPKARAKKPTKAKKVKKAKKAKKPSHKNKKKAKSRPKKKSRRR